MTQLRSLAALTILLAGCGGADTRGSEGSDASSSLHPDALPTGFPDAAVRADAAAVTSPGDVRADPADLTLAMTSNCTLASFAAGNCLGSGTEIQTSVHSPAGNALFFGTSNWSHRFLQVHMGSAQVMRLDSAGNWDFKFLPPPTEGGVVRDGRSNVPRCNGHQQVTDLKLVHLDGTEKLLISVGSGYEYWSASSRTCTSLGNIFIVDPASWNTAAMASLNLENALAGFYPDQTAEARYMVVSTAGDCSPSHPCIYAMVSNLSVDLDPGDGDVTSKGQVWRAEYVGLEGTCASGSVSGAGFCWAPAPEIEFNAGKMKAEPVVDADGALYVGTAAPGELWRRVPAAGVAPARWERLYTVADYPDIRGLHLDDDSQRLFILTWFPAQNRRNVYRVKRDSASGDWDFSSTAVQGCAAGGSPCAMRGATTSLPIMPYQFKRVDTETCGRKLVVVGMRSDDHTGRVAYLQGGVWSAIDYDQRVDDGRFGSVESIRVYEQDPWRPDAVFLGGVDAWTHDRCRQQNQGNCETAPDCTWAGSTCHWTGCHVLDESRCGGPRCTWVGAASQCVDNKQLGWENEIAHHDNWCGMFE